MSNPTTSSNQRDQRKRNVGQSADADTVDAPLLVAELGLHVTADIVAVAASASKGSAADTQPGFSTGGGIDSANGFRSGGSISYKADAKAAGVAMVGPSNESAQAVDLAHTTSTQAMDSAGGVASNLAEDSSNLLAEVAGDALSGAGELLSELVGGILS